MQDEMCDDGNAFDNVGCLDDCSGVIDGYSCSGGDTSHSDVCSSKCGDGKVLFEVCDDGNDFDNKGCSKGC